MSVGIVVKKTTAYHYVIALMLFLSAMTGFVPQVILSIGIVLCCAYLLYIGKLILAFPFIIFYNELYGKVFGLSVLRIFTFMLIFSILLEGSRRRKFSAPYLLPIIVYFFFLVLTMSQHSIQRAVFGFVDVICCIVLVMRLIKEDNIFKEFFRIFIYVAISAFVTGLFVQTSEMHGSEYTFQYLRFNATFEDPNYMGFFYNIAIFALVTLKLFSPKVRIITIAGLTMMLLASVSMTAVLVNVLVWAIYLLVTNKIKLKTILVVLLISVVAFDAYLYGLENPNAPVLGAVSYRINDKLISLNTNDINNLTTGRSSLLEENMSAFNNLSIINKLFGGVSVNGSFIDSRLSAASHNDYADMLLNVGYIGEGMILCFLLWRLWDIGRKYRMNRDSVSCCMFINKVIWIAYAFTLTMFLDYRFMFFCFM